MLFEQELQNQLVPEWRAKYLDYKVAKKKLNACEQALRKANQTPKFFPNSNTSQRTPIPPQLLSASATPHQLFQKSSREQERQHVAETALADATQALKQVNARRDQAGESQPLKKSNTKESWDKAGGTYGSLGSTPNVGKSENGSPGGSKPSSSDNSPEINTRNGQSPGNILRRSMSEAAPSLKLPGPAISGSVKTGDELTSQNESQHDLHKTVSVVQPGDNGTIHKHDSEPSWADVQRAKARRTFTSPYIHPEKPRGLFKRYFSRSHQPPNSAMELPIEAYREFDSRRADFFSFLDDQLEVVAEFYKDREDHAVERFEALQEQLELLKQHQAKRADKAAAERRNKKHRLSLGIATNGDADHGKKHVGHGLKGKIINNLPTLPFRPTLHTQDTSNSLKHPLEEQIDRSTTNLGQDYTRKSNDEVPYAEAKSKLKHALQELYRNLDMLKSYAMLNREAFRKIIKKYDKTISARHAGKFMSEKVDQNWFVKSDVIDTLLASTENVYAFFERGSHKVAATKLRAKHNIDYSPYSFRNGLYLGVGTALGLRGVIYAADIFYNTPDPVLQTQTSYLMQIYGGFFMALFLVLAFCIDCRFWTNNRINYVFIFEYDPRTSLDWRQLAEIPCLLYMIFGIIMYINFGPYGGGGPESPLWLYFPIILAGISVLLIFFPFQHIPLIYPVYKHGAIRFYKTKFDFLYPNSRAWFAFSNFRLFTGGLYPVEFRDFFLGDMYCSLTYAMGNIELFFCLYARGWNNPPICNSSNSMLFGFFTCLPAIWRALQCIRRYKDSGMAFPHLVNCGKYVCTILMYTTLSLYRLDPITQKKAIFIVFATINSIYTSIWDVAFDWSLSTHGERGLYFGQKHPPQRLGFPTWYYYPAVVIDPLLRFNWVFYPAILGELQHGSLLSFFIALSEIFRRSFWALFRVENEHMTNVGMFRASRDIPLPYKTRRSRASSTVSPSEAESQQTPASTPRKVVTAIAAAHTLDFERRKPRQEDSDDDGESDDDISSTKSIAAGRS